MNLYPIFSCFTITYDKRTFMFLKFPIHMPFLSICCRGYIVGDDDLWEWTLCWYPPFRSAWSSRERGTPLTAPDMHYWRLHGDGKMYVALVAFLFPDSSSTDTPAILVYYLSAIGSVNSVDQNPQPNGHKCYWLLPAWQFFTFSNHRLDDWWEHSPHLQRISQRVHTHGPWSPSLFGD